ncbi:MAG: RNA polymerase sigma factor [Fimbriimonas sp.]
MNLKSDTELLQAWHRARDEDAIRVLIERHGALLTGVARRRLSEADLAPDIAGRAFALMAARPTRVPYGEVTGWLVRVTTHLCDTENRAHRRRLVRETAASREFARSQTQMNRNADDLTHQIDDLLLKLRAEDRECLLLHAAEGLTHREVGERLGVSEDAARMRSNRAIDRIRRKLGLSASAVMPALERLKVTPLSASDQTRFAASARLVPVATAGSLSLTWILMTNAQRLAITLVAALLIVGGTGAAIRTQQATTKSALTLTRPAYEGFVGKWNGSFTYIVRRTGNRVTLRANTELNVAPNGLRMRVGYSEPGWAVDASIQVLPESKQLIYTDKGDRQEFKLIASSQDQFSGERFVDEPGLPRQERLTFKRQGNSLSVLIEERLSTGGWVFANEQQLQRAP